MMDKGLLYFYLKFILTQRFKELSKTFQTQITTETDQTKNDPKTVIIERKFYQNETNHTKLFETGKFIKSTRKSKTDIMSTNHEAYVNPSFDPEGDNIGKTQKNDGGVYNNGVSKTGKDELTPEEKYQKRKAEKAAREKERREREPMLLVKFITNHPKKAFGITLSGHIFFLVLTAILFVADYDILPLEFTRFPLDLVDDVDHLRGLSWDERNEDENNILDRGRSEESLTHQSQLLDTLQLLFYKEGGNVLTKENLQHIKRVENEFLENKAFKNDFCLIGANGQCSKPLSLIRFFDGTYSYASNIFNNPDFNNIEAVINEAQRNPKTIQTFQLLIAKTAVIEPDKVESWITGSFLSIGHPLKGYNYTIDSLILDRGDDQLTEAENFILDEIAPIGDEYFDDGVGNMDFAYGSVMYFSVWVLRQVFLDLALAIGSFAVIGLFICIQTGSLWIAGFAVFGILLSFVEANIIYRVILDYRYIGIFHILSVFIVLGIGADDVFVFCDTWKETGQAKYKSLAHRLSDAYRRSALAMLFTSLTTAVAFIVSATSPFLVVSAFGVFSGILITVNYISIIVYLPCVVVMHHLYFEKYKCCCCGKSSSAEISDVQQDTEQHAVRDNFIVRFYSGPYFRLITHKIARWIILFFYAAILGVFIYFASQLKVQEEQTKYAPESVNLGKYLELVNGQHFQASDDIRRIYVIFGLKNQDLSDCHKSDPTCFGKTVWDEKFNMDSPRVQQSFLNLCSTIRNINNETIDELQIRRHPVTKVPEVECFMEYVDTFYDEEENRMVNGVRRYPVGTDLMFPLDNDTVRLIMEHNTGIYNRSLIPNDWNSDFETAVSFWLYNGFQFTNDNRLISNPKLKTFDPLIGELKTENAIEKKLGAIDYYYGTQLRYAAITINTTINDADTGYIKGLPLRDRWEEVISGEIKKLEPELRNGYQATPASQRWNMWHWLKIQEVLVFNAFLGIIIGLAVALPILIIATNNIVTGFLATFTLISVTVMVIGLIPMAGWKLGLLESLNMVLVVGLAVDYTVHFAEGYSRSAHVDRKGRTRDALMEVGISVTSGALTTCTSSCFLIFAKIIFFQQFGIFMVTTLAFSFIWATGFFMTALAIIGPQDDFGCVTKMFTSVCCKKRNNDD